MLSTTENTGPNEDPTILDPTVPIPVMSKIYEGFGHGFSNFIAAASIGLRIALFPAYFIGAISALIFAYIKIRETQNQVELRRELQASRKRLLNSDHHYQYWSATVPSFTTETGAVLELQQLIKERRAKEIAECLVYHYQQMLNRIESVLRTEHDQQLKNHLIRLQHRLAMKMAAEASQFNNFHLAQILMTACGIPLVEAKQVEKTWYLKIFWNNLRKYYKSILTGAATAGGLTVIIVETALSTATLTLLFPWSILIIVGALIIGGIMGFILDKYLDRRHKNELLRNAKGTLNARNEKRLWNLWADLGDTLKEVDKCCPDTSDSKISDKADAEASVIQLNSSDSELRASDTQLDGSGSEITFSETQLDSVSSELKFSETQLNNPSSSTGLAPCIQSTLPALPAPPSLRANIDYAEVKALKEQSHIKRKIADFILPTLIAARAAFGAISTVFAGFAFAGLLLPWWPVMIIGLSMVLLFIAFKIINNIIKHRSEEEKIQSLNFIITPQKFRYWNLMIKSDDIELYVKQKTTEDLLLDLKNQYEALKKLLLSFEQFQNNPHFDLIQNELRSIHHKLILNYRAHADNLNNKGQLAKLYAIALTPLPQPPPTKKIITALDKVKAVLSSIDNFVVRNFKDIIQGAAFGFGTSITIFALLGFTSAMFTLWPLAVILGACLVGIAIKVAIRYGIKAYRNQRLLDIENHGEKPIQDKEQLMDCQAATALAVEKVERLKEQCQEMQSAADTLDLPKFLSQKPSRPLLWIESSGKIEDQSMDFSFESSPTPRLYG
jgi:hypothetical protein